MLRSVRLCVWKCVACVCRELLSSSSSLLNNTKQIAELLIAWLTIIPDNDADGGDSGGEPGHCHCLSVRPHSTQLRQGIYEAVACYPKLTEDQVCRRPVARH